MYVTKRSGEKERVEFNKISVRISKLCRKIGNPHINITKIAQTVIAGLYDGVHTTELDILAAETSASFASQHTDYSKLAGYIAVSNLHKETQTAFSVVISELYNYINPKTHTHSPIVTKNLYDIVMKQPRLFESIIVYERDYNFNYFGFKTLERSYLLKINGKIVERPQDMYMRVAIGIHGDNLPNVFETYGLLSMGIISHASPTMFSAGTPNAQLSSCFLLTMQDDSISGIFDTLGECARISKGTQLNRGSTNNKIYIWENII